MERSAMVLFWIGPIDLGALRQTVEDALKIVLGGRTVKALLGKHVFERVAPD